MTVRATPMRDCGWAVFLDVDGTLLDIAEAPDAVHVPPSLTRLLAGLHSATAHGFALISGRSLADLDRLFAPHVFIAAGLHGLERRDARGMLHRTAIDMARLEEARALLQALADRHATLLLENKGPALALHYRRAPTLVPLVRASMESALALAGPDFHLQPGKAVIELKPCGCSKRTAIEAFMREAPFAGRRPVFVGDDVTDEDGFAAVNACGGRSVRVGPPAPTVAREALPDVAAVHAWLEQLLMEGAPR